MKEDCPEPGRKHLPHLPPIELHNRSIIQYVTVNTARRQHLLGRPEIVALLINAWTRANRYLVGRYVIMPDHLRLFCAPSCYPITPLKKWVQFWRADVSRRWPYPSERPLWQKDFFDRQIRLGESYHEKWLYVWENPVRAGLVTRAADWPYQGELNVLMWHEGE